MSQLTRNSMTRLRKTLIASMIASVVVSPALTYADEMDELRMFAAPMDSAPAPAVVAAPAPAKYVPKPIAAPAPAPVPEILVSAPPVRKSEPLVVAPAPAPQRPMNWVTAPSAPVAPAPSRVTAPVVAAPAPSRVTAPLSVSQPVQPRVVPTISAPVKPAAAETSRAVGGGFLSQSGSSVAPAPRVSTSSVVTSAPSVSAVAVEPIRSAPVQPASQPSLARDTGSYFTQGVPVEPEVTIADEADTLPKVRKQAATFERSSRDSTYDRNLSPASEAELKRLFATAVRSALMINPQMRSLEAQGEAAEAGIGEAKGQRWPQVDVTAASPNKQFGSGNRTQQNNLPTLGLTIATNLYDFGQTSRTIESKEEQFTAATEATSAQREEIAWQVSSALIELNKQRLIIELSKQYVERMQQLTTMLSGIVQADAGRRSELTQARGRLLQAQSLLENAQSRARDSEITLRRLVGDRTIKLPSPTAWSFSFGSLTQQLQGVERHPGILKASAEARAALKEAEAVKASGKPKLNWVVSKNTAEDDFGRQQSWQTGLNVSWGLFRGGSNTSAERAAISRAESSRQLVQEQVREYEQRIRAADQDAHSMQDRAVLYRNLTLESDRIRVDFFDQWYHLGKRTLLDVLSAETDYYNNRVNEVSNRMDSYAAIFRGYASAGTLVSWLDGSKR